MLLNEILLFRSLIVACLAARLAIHQSIVTQPNIDDRLAEATKLFALAIAFRLFALHAAIFSRTSPGAHEPNLACTIKLGK